MTHGNRNPGASRRDALQTMIGIGAGLATAESLIRQQQRRRQWNVDPFLEHQGRVPERGSGKCSRRLRGDL